MPQGFSSCSSVKVSTRSHGCARNARICNQTLFGSLARTTWLRLLIRAKEVGRVRGRGERNLSRACAWAGQYSALATQCTTGCCIMAGSGQSEEVHPQQSVERFCRTKQSVRSFVTSSA